MPSSWHESDAVTFPSQQYPYGSPEQPHVSNASPPQPDLGVSLSQLGYNGIPDQQHLPAFFDQLNGGPGHGSPGEQSWSLSSDASPLHGSLQEQSGDFSLDASPLHGSPQEQSWTLGPDFDDLFPSPGHHPSTCPPSCFHHANVVPYIVPVMDGFNDGHVGTYISQAPMQAAPHVPNTYANAYFGGLIHASWPQSLLESGQISTYQYLQTVDWQAIRNQQAATPQLGHLALAGNVSVADCGVQPQLEQREQGPLSVMSAANATPLETILWAEGKRNAASFIIGQNSSVGLEDVASAVELKRPAVSPTCTAADDSSGLESSEVQTSSSGGIPTKRYRCERCKDHQGFGSNKDLVRHWEKSKTHFEMLSPEEKRLYLERCFRCACNNEPEPRRDDHKRHLKKCRKATPGLFYRCSCKAVTQDKAAHVHHVSECTFGNKKPGRPRKVDRGQSQSRRGSSQSTGGVQSGRVAKKAGQKKSPKGKQWRSESLASPLLDVQDFVTIAPRTS